MYCMLIGRLEEWNTVSYIVALCAIFCPPKLVNYS